MGSFNEYVQDALNGNTLEEGLFSRIGARLQGAKTAASTMASNVGAVGKAIVRGTGGAGINTQDAAKEGTSAKIQSIAKSHATDMLNDFYKLGLFPKGRRPSTQNITDLVSNISKTVETISGSSNINPTEPDAITTPPPTDPGTTDPATSTDPGTTDPATSTDPGTTTEPPPAESGTPPPSTEPGTSTEPPLTEPPVTKPRRGKLPAAGTSKRRRGGLPAAGKSAARPANFFDNFYVNLINKTLIS